MIVVVIVAKYVSLGQIALDIFVKLGRNKLPTFTKYEMKKIIRLFFSNIFPGPQQLAVGLQQGCGRSSRLSVDQDIKVDLDLKLDLDVNGSVCAQAHTTRALNIKIAMVRVHTHCPLVNL